MQKIVKVISCTTLLVISLGSVAESEKGQITAKVSTMGLGVEYNRPVNSVLSIGFGVNKFSKSKSLTEGNIEYDGNIDFKNLSVIANYHPWENGFRLRAGAYYNGNEVNLSASANDLTVGNQDFTGANVTLNGDLSFQKFAPYIGIGYGSEPFGDNNLSFDLDIGVMRSPVKTALTGTCVGLDICSDGTFDTELANERNELSDGVDGIDLYPVISIGLSYRF